MGDIFPFSGITHAVTLNRLAQDHRWLAFMLDRIRISGIDFVRVVASAIQAPDVLVA